MSCLDPSRNVAHTIGSITNVDDLMELLEKGEFDSADFEQKKGNIAQQLLQRKQSRAFSNWYADAKEKANIEDYRSRYYF